MKTHLRDSHNNKKVSQLDKVNLLLSDVLSSIEFRISKHEEFITRDEQLIKDNIDHVEMVIDAINRIAERKAKIGELREWVSTCLPNSECETKECKHPDYAMSKHGSIELCNNCGKSWG